MQLKVHMSHFPKPVRRLKLDNWHDGPEWAEWKKAEGGIGVVLDAITHDGKCCTLRITDSGGLVLYSSVRIHIGFPSPAAALTVANAIIAAWSKEEA